MKRSLLFWITILLIHPNLLAQNPQLDWNNRAAFTTDGSEKSDGIRLSVSVPKNWEASESPRPHIVKRFSSKGTTSSIAVFTRGETETLPLLNNIYLRKLGATMGNVLLTRIITIDGIKAGEVTYDSKSERAVATIYVKAIVYIVPFKNKEIWLTYSCGGTNVNEAKQRFSDYLIAFKGLGSSLVILNQY